jgi:Spy/CpxP family protein refolding chaperone
MTTVVAAMAMVVAAVVAAAAAPAPRLKPSDANRPTLITSGL